MSLAADLRGKVAMVTGASGSLGGHFARCLANAGASVVLAARREDVVGIMAREIQGGGGAALAVRMDVIDEASVESAFAQAERRFGPVDVLINNSGIAQRSARALEIGAGEFAQVVEVDLLGAYRVARTCALRLEAATKPGSIVNIASILGIRVSIGVAAYAAAKAGLIKLTEALALEWARLDIRVNALAPGYIATKLNRDFLDGPAGQAMLKRIPQRRLGRLEDLDGPLLLLASDASRYMTGTVVTVDGGHLVTSI